MLQIIETFVKAACEIHSERMDFNRTVNAIVNAASCLRLTQVQYRVLYIYIYIYIYIYYIYIYIYIYIYNIYHTIHIEKP